MTESYRDQFIKTRSGLAYDADQYAPGSFWDVMWQLEREILSQIVAELRRNKDRISYLDFACGTGRVLAYVETLCDDSTGIDIAPAMLERASVRVKKAALLQRDVTLPGAAVE